ncbi:mucin-2-like isoform X2 [Ruditapes philippinarum]|uniref:mucin-2-like isoform X2 n=1 Tax=Ruditapes philippinarum TaxID=129788 RepID=UPI00295B6769|nr:mucin-2-like isoform X2 [Ruditapes philippinarum]
MNGFQLLGLLVIGTFVIAVDFHEHSKQRSRTKRFLFNRYQPDTHNGNISRCCNCDDLGNGTSCYERCRSGIQRDDSEHCTYEMCSVTVTLIIGKFYLLSRCENKTSCLNNVTSIDDAKNNRCDSLKKSDMVDGTVCRYCCESYNDVSSIACLKNLETIINHTYSQNAVTSSTSFSSSQSSTISSSSRLSTTSPSFLSSTSSSPRNTLQYAELTCETCINSTNCKIETCKTSDNYCENVISFDNGLQKIIKKSCSTIFECKYDHSMRNSECDPTNAIKSKNYMTCHYCCQATRNSPPCNTDNIPNHLDWFDEKTSEGQSLNPSSSSETTPGHSIEQSMSTALLSISSEVPTGHTTRSSIYASVASNQTTPGIRNTSTQIYNTSTFPNISNANRSISPLTFNITKPYPNGSNTSVKTSPSIFVSTSISELSKSTTQKSIKSSTKKSPFTISPSKSIRCKVCSGPDFLCEKLYTDQDCVYPNNYCLNTVRNYLNGTRSVNRRCDNFQNCYRNWFLGSSDVDKCRRYDERQIVTLEFDCTFCCIQDGCNKPLRPTDETLYKDV